MGVHIKAVVDGFRRGGIAHKAKGTYYPAGFFTEAKLEQFRQEPNLLVTETAGNDLPSGQDDQLIQEMGDTIAQLEHSLEQARAGLKAASSDLVGLLEHHKKAPALIIDAVRALEPVDPATEGVIVITSEGLAVVISNHLTPEAHDDGHKTLDNPSGLEAPSNPPPASAIPSATGPGTELKADKAATKRATADKKGTGE